MPPQHGLGPDQEEMASPVLVEAPDDEPEELVASAEARPALGAEGDLELLAEEQVLEEEALAAAERASEGGQEEAEEFDHPRQDRRSSPTPPGPARLLPPYRQIGLAGFVHTHVATWNLLMAGPVIAAVPMLVV